MPEPSIPTYAIERVLGRGGMGVVYLARDLRLGRLVALKVLADFDLPDTDRTTRFLREARAAAAIRHPNVATIYEAGHSDERTPFIALEYCEGQNLSNLIRQKALDGRAFLKLAEQIAAGLAAAHRNNVIHRDIKSANIMVEADGTAKILDFGLAKLLEQQYGTVDDPTLEFSSHDGNFFGTVPYISPEQARGMPADARSDLFSTGIVFYEAVTGILPFQSESPLATLEKIKFEEPIAFAPMDPSFPPEAADIISRLLQKKPEDRFQTAEELEEAIRDLRDRTATIRPLTSGRQSTFGRTVRPSPLKKYATIGMALALLLIIGAVALYKAGLFRSGAAITAPTAIRSIAVLPFANLSKVAEEDFLIIGLADTLATRLQQIPALQVRPTSAILEFKREKVDARTAGERLKVDGVLEGHFLSSGNRLRINLQLTDCRTGYGIWAATVDGRRDDLMSLMDLASTKATAALRQKISQGPGSTGGSEARSSSPEAYEAYLRSRALTGTLIPKQHDEQIQLLERAIELDPGFAAAYAELAISMSLGQIRGLNRRDMVVEAERYARQAVRLDPNLAEAHLALGRTLIRVPGRFTEAVRENLAALRLNPKESQALYTIVSYFISTGDVEKAACLGKKFVESNPTSNDAKTRGYWNVNSVDAAGSLSLSQLALASPETRLAGHDMRGLAFLLKNDLRAARREQKLASGLSPQHFSGNSLRAMIAASEKDRPEMENAIAALSRDAETNHWVAQRIGLAYAKIGDTDKAVEWFSRSAALGNHSWYFLTRHPWLAGLQQNPRFQYILSTVKQDLDAVEDDVIGIHNLICGKGSVPSRVASSPHFSQGLVARTWRAAWMRDVGPFRAEGIVEPLSRSEKVVQRSRPAAIRVRSRDSVRNAG